MEKSLKESGWCNNWHSRWCRNFEMVQTEHGRVEMGGKNIVHRLGQGSEEHGSGESKEKRPAARAAS